jgi:NADPH2:quinone reductase
MKPEQHVQEMRAVVVPQFGGPEVLESRRVPIPKLRPHDVLLRVEATSINPVDAKIRRNPNSTRTLPLILGFDVCGIVEDCGAEARGFGHGDRVIAACSLVRDGANAEHVAVDSRTCAPAPAKLTPEQAAALPLAGVTAWGALHERARIRAGETVLIQAGAGGVGHLAVQFARLHGCRVIATAGRPESIAFCRDVLQADEVLDYRTVDVPARVRELTGGRGLRAVFDFVGGEVFRQSAECLAPSGHLVTILGADPGAVGQTLLWKNATVHYEFMGTPTLYDLDCAAQGQTLRGIARLADEGRIRPHVSQVLALDALADAHRAIETGRTIGKIAIRVAPGRTVGS